MDAKKDRSMTHVSVVIPTYNRADSLKIVLDMLARQTLKQTEFEVIVIDDGSKDHTDEVIERATLLNLHYERQTNQGEIVARDTGVARASGEVLTFLDDDIYVSPSYLETLLHVHRGDERRVVIGNIYQRYLGSEVDPRNVLRQLILKNESPMDELVPFFELCGHSFLLTQQTYTKIGGMKPLSEDGRNAWGGIDFGYRAHRQGCRVYRAGAAIGIHNDHSMRSYRTKAVHWERVCALAVLLLQRHPELRGQIPMLRDKDKVDWESDSLPFIAKKLLKRFSATPGLTELIDTIVTSDILSAWHPRLQQWGLEPHMVRGFRKGLREHGELEG